MNNPTLSQNRRRFLQQLGLGAAFFSVPGLFAEELTRTPAQTEGPFYPDHLPLDTDNDLIIVNNGITPAVGEITHLTGRILDGKGDPIRDAYVEIWEADGNGVYFHSGDKHAARDPNFQGFGRFLTGSSGEYYFRTIKPVQYPGRCPHIHFKVKRAGHELLTTQCYIKGHPSNQKDGIYKSIKDPKALASVSIDFTQIKESKTGDFLAKFDIIIGTTPEA